jgi:hypothetical protein
MSNSTTFSSLISASLEYRYCGATVDQQTTTIRAYDKTVRSVHSLRVVGGTLSMVAKADELISGTTIRPDWDSRIPDVSIACGRCCGR